jgi:hypothetical protein
MLIMITIFKMIKMAKVVGMIMMDGQPNYDGRD